MISIRNKYITIAGIVFALYLAYTEISKQSDKSMNWSRENELLNIQQDPKLLGQENKIKLDVDKKDRSFIENIIVESMLDKVPKKEKEE